MTTPVLVFKKIDSEDKAKYDKFYSSSKAEKIINKSDIDNVSQPIYTRIITKRQKYIIHFSRYCLRAFITEKFLKCHIKDCFV